MSGLSVKKCKELAFQFAAANKLSVPHSWEISKKSGNSGGKDSNRDIKFQLELQKLHLLAVQWPLIITMSRNILTTLVLC